MSEFPVEVAELLKNPPPGYTSTISSACSRLCTVSPPAAMIRSDIQVLTGKRER